VNSITVTSIRLTRHDIVRKKVYVGESMDGRTTILPQKYTKQ